MDDLISQFTAVTSAEPERAAQYLRLTEGNLEQAIQLFYDSPALDLNSSNAPPEDNNDTFIPSGGTRRGYREDGRGVVHIDSEDEELERMDMDRRQPLNARAAQHASSSASRLEQPDGIYEDDAAIAQRLQNEMYESAGHADEVRAPMARTTETLVGPDASWGSDEDGITAAVAEQMMARHRRAYQRQTGIFNQRASAGSVWDDDDSRRQYLRASTAGASETSSKSNHLAELYRPPFEIMSPLSWTDARDEGKEEEKWILVNIQDSAIFDCQVLNRDVWKNEQVKDTVRENFIFMQYAKDDPRASQYIQYYFQAYESQDAYPHIAIVDPRTGEQVKVWSGPPVPKPMDFLMQLHEFLDRYSLKADARNPVATRKADRSKDLDVNRMSEEEMLQMAMKNSLANGKTGPKEGDPDELTRTGGTGAVSSSASAKRKGKASMSDNDADGDGYNAGASGYARNGTYPSTSTHRAGAASNKLNNTSTSGTNTASKSSLTTATPSSSTSSSTTMTTATASPFARISSTTPHTEPAPPFDPSRSTRIQFRYSGGRQIRVFALSDPVRRLYEWLKASPLIEKKDEADSGGGGASTSGSGAGAGGAGGEGGKEFELIFLGKNLIEVLDKSVEEAGLRNGTVMVEFVEG